jgi:predicted GIY-YIG superfamily endonuclease
MVYGYIYKIEFPNGKHYIGLTTSLEQRTKEHKRCAKSDNTFCLYKALRKYDMVDTFELIEIDTADTLEELYEKEMNYIQIYNSYYIFGKGYNMTYGGDGTHGYIYTEKDKEKMRESRKKYFEENPDALKKMSEVTKKQWENLEIRKQMCESHKKYFEENPEARNQIKETMKKHYENNPEAFKERIEKVKQHYEDNPEARQKMSEIKKKQFKNPEIIEKCSKSQKKRFENQEERQKTREKTIQYFQKNPDAGKEHSEKMKKYYEDNPQAKQRMSEIKKKHYQESAEAKQKISDIKGQNKPFDVFTTDGTFIKTFFYQFEAKEYLQKEIGITSTIKISSVLTGNRKSSAGFVFTYK